MRDEGSEIWTDLSLIKQKVKETDGKEVIFKVDQVISMELCGSNVGLI